VEIVRRAHEARLGPGVEEACRSPHMVSGVDTETVAVISSSIVALAAIAAGWLQHRGSLKHQREAIDLDNVRDVLDEAAVALHETAYVLDTVRSDLTREGPAVFSTDSGSKIYTQLEERGKELDALTERLAVRLSRDHAVSREFLAADMAVLKLFRAVGQLRRLTRSDGSPSAERQIERLVGRHEERIGINRERFETAREGFMAAAHEIAGIRLPRPRRARVRIVRDSPRVPPRSGDVT
jgi:hypothetical protein